MKNEIQQIHSFINSVITVADKFINKVETGRARSKETYSDLQKLKNEAIILQKAINDVEAYNRSK